MIIKSLNRLTCDEHFVVSNPSEVLARLASPDADIVILPQELQLDLDDLGCGATVHEKRIVLKYATAKKQISDELLEMSIDHSELSVEMLRSIDVFAELFEQEQFDLRLEVTDKQSCPKFHCDNVYVRMLVTYFGPTTEFIDQNNPDDVHHLPLNALVFLKGHKHPTYQHRILHRSPLLSAGEKRLCMIVNFCDWMPRR